MSSQSNFLMNQIVPQAAVLIAYLIGIVLALVTWGRNPGPSLMALLACLLLLAVTLGHTFMVEAIIQRRGGTSSIVDQLRLLAIVSGVLRAGAFGMLLTAAFGWRARAAGAGFPVAGPLPMVPPPPGGFGPGARR